MAYTKTNWINGTTPINATNLNHIETGIKDLETDIDTNLKGSTVLWYDDNGLSPNGQTIQLEHNIYNYRFAVIVGQWGIKFIVPIVASDTYFNGGMAYATGDGTGMATAGITASIIDDGDSISITYFRQLNHTQSSNHGTLQNPKLYKVIGIV